MTQELWIYVEGINPVPWKSPQMGRGRAYKDAQLAAYQAALGEEVADMLDNHPAMVGDAEIHFYFKRQIEVYTAASGRKSSSHRADASNLTKAAEDALQKVLFKNDNQHWRADGVIYEQTKETTPGILIHYIERPVWVPLSIRERLRTATVSSIERIEHEE